MSTIENMYGPNWALSEGGRQQYAYDLNNWQSLYAGMENPPPPPDPTDKKYYTEQYVSQQPTMNNQVIGSSWVNASGASPTVLDPSKYDLQLMPAATNGADNKYAAADSWLAAGAFYDPSREYWNRMYYIPKEGTPGYVPNANVTNLVDLNPEIPEDNFLDKYLPALALGAIGGGALGLFGGGAGAGAVGAAEAATAAGGSTLADLYGAATGMSVASAPAAATGSALYGAATGALPAAAGLSSLSNLTDYTNFMTGASPTGTTAGGTMDYLDWFNLGTDSPMYDLGASYATPDITSWDQLISGGGDLTADWANSLSSIGVGSTDLASIASGGMDALDLIQKYGQSAAKALGLTKSDGSIDWGRIAGGAGSAALGMYGASHSSDAMERISDKYMSLGAPYRQKLSDLYTNPDSFLTSKEVTTPVQQGTDALARALSVKGNPTGNATALQEMQNYSSNMLFGKLGEEKNRLGSLGGLMNMPASVGMSADIQGAQDSASGLNALGYGLNSIVNPKPSSTDLWKQFTNSLA